MKLLLDTHILMWTLAGDPRLSAKAGAFIEDSDSELYCSVITIWKTSIKYAKRPERTHLSGEMLIQYCADNGIRQLPLYFHHISMLDTLTRAEEAPAHNDPFDKMMIAQAKAENMFFLTHDGLLRYYDEPCILYV